MTDGRQKSFRVIIVGGSVAGLTFAHCLRQQNVDFVVLESRTDFAAASGISISIAPNGARILDQLGLYDEIIAAAEPVKHLRFWTEDGGLIAESSSLVDTQERYGYPTAFMDRKYLMDILYEGLGDSKDRILRNKKVVKFDHCPSNVTVECADGTKYEADIVVGADGIRSKVRAEMWRHVGESLGRRDLIKREKEEMKAHYSCIFGISTSTPGLSAGHAHRTLSRNCTLLTFVGKDARVYWFLIARMNTTYTQQDMPWFNQQQREEQVQMFLGKHVAAKVKFAAVYQNVVSAVYVPLEETLYQLWACDRFACIGDSIHKVTPNISQSGSSAIESAASLANHLNHLLKSNAQNRPSLDEMNRHLSRWQNMHKPRMKRVWRSARNLTRLEAFATSKDQLVGRYMLPYLEKYFNNKISSLMIGAVKLDYLKIPPRSLDCSLEYNPRYDIEHSSKGMSTRIWWVFPLIVFSTIVYFIDIIAR